MEKHVDKKIAVFGIYRSRTEAETAVDRFKQAEFRNSDISVLLPEGPAGADSPSLLAHEKQTKSPEGATTGAGTGAILGGTLGWLVGIGALAIPGMGPFIAAGPIISALAGAGVGGTLGGVSGALIGMGFPEYEAKRYEGLMKDGGILLSVHCDDHDWAKRARMILDETGAKDISSTSEENNRDRDDDQLNPPAARPGMTREDTFLEVERARVL